VLEQTRVIPFWFLNDNLKTGKETAQLEKMADAGVKELIVCARQGLPKGLYLSEGWFDHFGHILNEAKRLGMGVWIYDDFNWPSGTMGGKLTQNGSPYVAKVLGYQHGEFSVKPSSFQLPYQHRAYIDVLNTEACSEFINGTHEEYKKRFGADFGSSIKGFFTDEPGFYANLFGFVDGGTLPYTDDILEEFENRRGYNPREMLHYIWEEKGEPSRTIRQDYFLTLSELYPERFLGRLSDWCHENKLLLIGHLLPEEKPLDFVKSQADPIAAAGQFDWAGFDIISAFSKSHQISATFARSIAQIYNLPEIMAEAFGGFGWEMPPSEIKRVSNWLVEQGTGIIVPHALYNSIRNGRRHESPPSLMETPYWDEFRALLRSFPANVAEHKRQPADTAIYYPIKALWADYNPRDEGRAREISNTLHDITLAMPNADYINDDVLMGRNHSYRHIVLPRARTLPIESARSIKEHLQSGGKVTIVGEYPKFAQKPKNQAEFLQIMNHLYMQPKVDFIPMVVSDSSTASRLEALQYRVWHELTIVSPLLGALMIRAKHLLLGK